MSSHRPPRFLQFGHAEAHAPKFELPGKPSPGISRRRIALVAVAAVAAAFLGQWFHHVGEGAAAPAPGAAWLLPFVLLLLAIALMPFIARRFWERHYHHVALGLAALMAAYYVFLLRVPALPGGGTRGLFAAHAGATLARSLSDYLSFLFLMASLFVVSGGILIRVRRTATPTVNTLFLLSGALLANVLGTTGAAMLLIRPYLRMNQGHLRPYHVVFFIFLIADVGGCLTPMGPPLFLGYLKGIPFWWFAQMCWPMWLVAVGLLLAMFFVFDTLADGKQKRRAHDREDLGPAIALYGAANLLLIALVLAGLLLHDPLERFFPLPWRELLMGAAACLSLWITPQRIHEENVFSFAPIREIAFLFVGIFATMAPALDYLANHAAGLREYLYSPGQNYFAAGTLSSVLDNAPTYLTFVEAQLSRVAPPAVRMASDQAQMAVLLGDASAVRCLVAISLASVFFGALTYIGNGPNFMVRSIAEHGAGAGEANVCPTFFGYIFRYALPLLGPVLVLIWLIFLR